MITCAKITNKFIFVRNTKKFNIISHHIRKKGLAFNFLRSRKEYEVSGFFLFSPIQMRGYNRLGQAKVNDCPAGLENQPYRVRAFCRGQKRRKATRKIRRNPQLRFLPLILYFLLETCYLRHASFFRFFNSKRILMFFWVKQGLKDPSRVSTRWSEIGWKGSTESCFNT